MDMKRVGFTLVELLVVIAVIATLVAIALPVARMVKQRAKAVMCKSNLKQLSTAFMIYEYENGTFPNGFNDSSHDPAGATSGYPGTASLDKKGWWWFNFLAGTLGENFEKGTVFWCPSRNIEAPFILCANYGVNRSICKDAPDITGILDSEFVGEPLGLNKIRRPSQALLVLDSGYSLISWQGVTNADVQPFENPMRAGAFYVPGLVINKERTISPEFESDALDGRHPNRTVNVVFADGHSARLRADDLFVKEIDGNYTNRSPLWLPD
ncbi:MAG: type II secretion system protein [Planctomycetota bacterium]